MNRFIGQFHPAELQIIITHSNCFNYKTQKKTFDVCLLERCLPLESTLVPLTSVSDFSLLAPGFWLLAESLSLSFMLRPMVSRPVCLGIKHPFGAYDQIFITRVTVTVLFLWGALSNERTGLSFIYAAGPCQRSLSLVRVPWDSRPSFTVSDLRLTFSSPPTTRRVTVEVFDPSSTRGFRSTADWLAGSRWLSLWYIP
jgi:hypothetical protein